MAHDARERDAQLPGLLVSARRGAGPQSDDIALPGGLHLASKARGMVENAQPSRVSRRRPISRRLSEDELAEWIDRTVQFDGDDTMNRVRDHARQLAPALGVREESFAHLDQLVGVALNTRDAKSTPRILAARRSGRPFDPVRVERFDVLAKALRSSAPQSRLSNDGKYLPFYEAYFSNFIEGTEFTVDEAEGIIYRGFEPEGRPADAHDIIGTYKIVSDSVEMSRVATSPDEFMDLLRSRHAEIMASRPEKLPGQFKTSKNQAGNTIFVHPDLVVGTLTEGFARIESLDSPWERAVMSMFVTSDVHPFADGNGRIARLTMNTELVAGHECRIIVPTGFRDDYLGGLRRLSREDEPGVYIKSMRFAQDWTSGIEFDSLDAAEVQMMALNAFEAEGGLPLRMPDSVLMEGGLAFAGENLAETSLNGWVESYSRRDGTLVRGHRRNLRRRR
ncbi:MAG: Fic family protein [Acidimicrobiales bacterium]